ncbi:MAG: phage tail protein [Balneolaceae bacterium]|nr:phage tail protein [Balneolaceae bacterium]
MDEPFISMLMAWAANFAPKSWAYCNGQQMQISQNQALFALIGTTYGGNGSTYFNLPDLRGRAPIGAGQIQGGSQYTLGQQGGVESVTLTANEMPAHTHGAQAGSISVTPVYSTNNASRETPQAGDVPAKVGVMENRVFTPQLAYGNKANTVEGASLAGSANVNIDPAGGSMPHTNMQPYLVINWVIALQGIFPQRD